VSGSNEGRWFHEVGEPAAAGDGTSDRAGTSKRWDVVPQLPSKGGKNRTDAGNQGQTQHGGGWAGMWGPRQWVEVRVNENAAPRPQPRSQLHL